VTWCMARRMRCISGFRGKRSADFIYKHTAHDTAS